MSVAGRYFQYCLANFCMQKVVIRSLLYLIYIIYDFLMSSINVISNRLVCLNDRELSIGSYQWDF